MDLRNWLQQNHPSAYEAKLEHERAYEASQKYDPPGGWDEHQEDLDEVRNDTFNDFVNIMIVCKIRPPTDLLGDCDVCPSQRFLWNGPDGNCDGGMIGCCLDCGHWCVH